jgi:hypothetical protein
MKRILLAAVAAFGFAAGAVQAGEGNQDPFPPATDGTQVVSSPATPDTGSEAYPIFSGPTVPVISGGVLPSNGSEGIVQSANSLPRGFADGTPAYAYAQSVNRYFAARAQQAVQTAQTARRPPRG